MSTFNTKTSFLRLGVLISVLLPTFLAATVYLSLPYTAYAVITSASQLSTGCLTNPSTCSAEENAFLDSQQATFNSPANNQGQAAQLANQGANASSTRNGPPAASVCDGFISCIMWLPNALFKGVVTLLAGFLIYLSTWVLSISALLFNWLIENTIIQFGTFYGTIKVAVETAWTAFRDIANILIIGIFTFVAISIIVGLKEYGQKKMIAHVLIVAVLINFSLLFTKMIIDASNYTAAQIYTAAALGGTNTVGQGGGAVGATGTATKYGIAEQFMYLLGVQTFSNSFKLVNDTANANGAAGGGIALLHGILVMTVLLGAAMVLFYGSFLLVSRMIMLIFLMVTASIAVGSSLIPGWGGGNYGWKAWKNSLVWCVTLAPMLMILLWMTLNVAGAIRGASTGTLGESLSNPASGTNISALFSYVLVLGLLFTTFKVSSMWASKIGGFSMAAMVPALGVAGMGRLAGLLGKNTVGRAAGSLSRRAESIAARNDGKGFVRSALYGGLAKQVQKQLEKPTKRDFNIMNTKFGKDITGIAGLKGGLAGETKGKGVEGDDKAAAEAYAKRSEKAAEIQQKDLAKDEKAIREQAAREVADLPENKEKQRLMREAQKTAEKQLEESKKTREENEAGHKAALKEAEKQVEVSKSAGEKIVKESEQNMKTIVSQLERDKEYTPEGSDQRKNMESQIAAARAEHDAAMNREEKNINDAHAAVARIQSLQKAEVDAEEGHKKTLADIAEQNNAFEAKIKTDGVKAGDKAYAEAQKNVSVNEIAGRLVPDRLTNITGKTADNDRLTALTRKHLKESGEEKAIKKLIKQQDDASKKSEAEKKPEADKPADH